MFNPKIKVNATVSNEQVRNEFKCSLQGGMRRSHKSGELRPHMPARSISVATSRTAGTPSDRLAMWLKDCPIQLTDAQRETLRQIAGGTGGV